MNAFAIPICLLLASGAPAAPSLTLEQKEAFLRRGAVSNPHTLGGVTGSSRVTLDDGTLRHDAQIQSVNESKSSYTMSRGTELNFRDSYKYNIAAYELAKLLGISDMIPPSVERKVAGKTSAVTWWVDDVMMDEAARVRKKIEPPDVAAWNLQTDVVRVFDELIFNVDRHLGNLLIDRNWKVWMIDHTRSFRLGGWLREADRLSRCDRQLLDRMRGLDKQDVRAKLGRWLTGPEIDGLLARRDLIVRHFDAAAAKGASVLYDRMIAGR